MKRCREYSYERDVKKIKIGDIPFYDILFNKINYLENILQKNVIDIKYLKECLNNANKKIIELFNNKKTVSYKYCPEYIN